MKHYTFFKGAALAHEDWLTVAKQPIGTYSYSPEDDSQFQWGWLVKTEHGLDWVAMEIEQIPKEFRAELLLMGVPT